MTASEFAQHCQLSVNVVSRALRTAVDNGEAAPYKSSVLRGVISIGKMGYYWVLEVNTAIRPKVKSPSAKSKRAKEIATI